MQIEESEMPKDKKGSSKKATDDKADHQEPIEAQSEVGPEQKAEDVLGEKFKEAETARDEFKDKYLRIAAEMDNMRRRFEREKSDLLQYGLEKLVKDLLPVLDSFDKALPERQEEQADEGDQQSMLSGLILVKKQLTDLLSRNGLQAIAAEGKPFDPNLHQAIQRIDTNEVEVETVKTEFARGYTLNGRLIRPAMVAVLVPNTESDSSEI